MSLPPPPSPSWPVVLEQLLAGGDLRAEEARALMQGWLEERIDPVLTGALLTALRVRGVTGEELAAMALVLRQACPLPAPRPELPLVDTCGTGGDGTGSFNISTATAFVAAACGAHVAKHGNRSASGSVGSADVLEHLGLRLQAPLPRVIDALPRAGVTFLFAPGWHPALVGLAPLRRTLGIRTVFNLLGPLVNPLSPETQVLGVARPSLLDPMADALRRLGLQRAVVVHGHGGLDEASLSGPNELRLLENGEIRTEYVDPWELGLTRADAAALQGGDVATNARILEEVLRGGGSDAQRDVVVLNAALVLWASGVAAHLREGLDRAAESLASGAPWRRLDRLRAVLAGADSDDAAG